LKVFEEAVEGLLFLLQNPARFEEKGGPLVSHRSGREVLNRTWAVVPSGL
jgi:hypothetical protein